MRYNDDRNAATERRTEQDNNYAPKEATVKLFVFIFFLRTHFLRYSYEK